MALSCCKKLVRLFRGITSNDTGDYYCLSCFHSYRTNNVLKKHEESCGKNHYCHEKMPREDNKILNYNHGEKSLKAPFTIIADLECILPKTSSCQNNPEESCTEIKAMNEPSGYSLITCYSFEKSKEEQSFYREKDCMESFSKDLRNQAMKIINYEKEEIIPVTYDEEKSYEKQKVCYICKKKFCTNKNDEKEFKIKHKVRDHCHYTGKFRGAAHNICNLRYKIPREIPVVFHNGSTYDYHFIIKQLAEEFKGQFRCLGENTEKYITFSVPIKKETDNNKTIIYKLKFIDSYRFMSASLSSLVDNLSEINKKECKTCMERNNIKSECKFIEFKNNILNYKCKECGKKCFKSINELIKKFSSTYRFCNKDLNKFVLLLRKGVYRYEYIDNWEKFNETSLPIKKIFIAN